MKEVFVIRLVNTNYYYCTNVNGDKTFLPMGNNGTTLIEFDKYHLACWELPKIDYSTGSRFTIEKHFISE